MATINEPQAKDTTRSSRTKRVRPHIAALAKRAAQEDRETLDLLEAYDRGDPEAVRQLRGKG